MPFTCVGHVIHEDGQVVLHGAHQDHWVHFTCHLPFFVNQDKFRLQSVHNLHGSAHIGGNDDTVLPIYDVVPNLQVLQVLLQDHRLRVQIIHGDVKESLDLRGMQLHGDDVDCPSNQEHTGHKFHRNWSTTLVLFILADVWKTWDHLLRPPWMMIAGIDHNEKFHQFVIDLSTATMDNVDIVPSHAFNNLHAGLLVVELLGDPLGHLQAQPIGHMLGQVWCKLPLKSLMLVILRLDGCMAQMEAAVALEAAAL